MSMDNGNLPEHSESYLTLRHDAVSESVDQNITDYHQQKGSDETLAPSAVTYLLAHRPGDR
jgi:hypothetical protein